MKAPELELEGTWEEIQARIPDFNGKRLKVTVRVAEEAPRKRPGSLEEALEEIRKTVPDSAWETLPPDFSDNLDHYIYGTPKRS